VTDTRSLPGPFAYAYVLAERASISRHLVDNGETVIEQTFSTRRDTPQDNCSPPDRELTSLLQRL